MWSVSTEKAKAVGLRNIRWGPRGVHWFINTSNIVYHSWIPHKPIWTHINPYQVSWWIPSIILFNRWGKPPVDLLLYSVQCEILSLRDECSVADEHLLRKTSCILFYITGLRGFPICFNNQSYCPTSGNRPANRCSCSLQLFPPTVGVWWVCQGWVGSSLK